MPIEFSCQACGQAYSVKDEFAGRTTKCRKCSQQVTVPVPATPELEPLGALGSFLDDEIGPTQPIRPETPPTASGPTVPCPSCASPMPQSAALCVKCGYDVATGKTRVTQRPDEAAKKKKKKREAGESSGMLLLARGIALSGAGALLGAVAWALVAVATHREIGWIAWGVGAAAGGGMSLGYDDKSDGTVPGILAAFIALGGIVMGKVFILVWVLFPLLTGNLEDFAFQREAVAGNMATKALEQRGVDPDDEAAFEQEYNKSLQALAEVSDEEVERRFTAMTEEARTEWAQAEVEPPEAGQGEINAVVIVEGQPPVVLGPEPAEEDEPSLVGAFFSTMFGPMDALFILLAFFTAYKVGSGSMTE